MRTTENNGLRTRQFRFITDNINCLNRKRICEKHWYCNGEIECPWLSPNDEANCSECSSFGHVTRNTSCDCNKKENFNCEWNGNGVNKHTCYDIRSK